MNFIAYFRVSTAKQGIKGLGMEAQKLTVNQYITANNGNLIAEFVEVESGKKTNRNELNKALELAKEKNATLIVSKLDRLARNVEFIFTLKNSGVTFVACDLPDFNTLTIGIFATMAQHERELISKRTKEGLSVKKTQLAKEGKTLGTPVNLTAAATAKGLEVRKHNAATAKENIQALELVEMYRAKGLTLQQIADKLNKSGYKTRRGKMFTTSQIQLLLTRIK